MHLLLMGRALLFALLVTGCDYWSLSINSDGFVHVTVIGGDDFRPRDGYRIRVTRASGASYEARLPASGVLRVEHEAGETVSLALIPPAGCMVSSPVSPVSLDVSARAAFELSCSAAA